MNMNKVTADCDFNDREFQTLVIKKLNKIQVNSGKQFNELRNKTNK